MFTAPQAYAETPSTHLATPAPSYWRAVEIELSAQWYIVQLLKKDGPDPGQRDMLVSWTADLLSIIQTKQIAVTSIQMMEPVPVRGEAPWRSRDLARVWIASERGDTRKEFVVLETTDGQRRCDIMVRGSTNGLTNYKLVWESELRAPPLQTA